MKKKTDHQIVNKKSVKTATKKAKAEEEGRENNVAKLYVDFPGFNLQIGEILVSNFEQLTPILIEFSDQQNNVVEDSDKDAFRNELERIRQERERIRQEELKKLREQLRSEEEELFRESQRQRDQNRLKRDENTRMKNRMGDDERNRQFNRLRDDERRREEEAVRNDHRLRSEDLLKDSERRRGEDRSREEDRLAGEERNRNHERLNEENRSREDNRRRNEERLREDERKREEDRIREEERLKDEERKREEENRAENERIKEQERLRDEEREREEERRREEERLRQEEKDREEERINQEKNDVVKRRLEEERKKEEEMNDLLKEFDDEDEEFLKLLKQRRKRKTGGFNNPKYRGRVYRPLFQTDNLDKEQQEKLWSYMDSYIRRDDETVEKEIVRHVELSLGRNRFRITKSAAYYGAAYSIRDRLQEMWNDYEYLTELENPKRVNFVSIEFMMGRLLRTNLINLNLEEQYRVALQNLGFNLEEILDLENDPGLGKSGLGKLASCFIDSLTTYNIPAFGYGLRYDYGHFQQRIENNQQREFSEFWLLRGNPFEIPRLDVKYTVRFYGNVRFVEKDGRTVCVRENTLDVVAVAYDTIISGWETFNVNNLRLWKSYPAEHFNFENFHKTNYQGAIFDKNATSHLTSVMYPNENTPNGKEFKLMQQYFLVSATIQDIVKRFIDSKLPWSEFNNKNVIHISDVHPALSISELLRILVDDYGMDLQEAIEIVNRSFSFTCHNVLQSHMQQWYVDFFGKLLPRNMEMIYILNHYFLESVRAKYPVEWNRHREMSCIEETRPKQIRMHNFAIVGSYYVNGISKTQSRFLKQKFHYFDEFFPKRIINITNGVNARRWVNLAFPELADLLTRYSKNTDWIEYWSNLEELKKEGMKDEETKACLIKDLSSAKLRAKTRLVNWLKLNYNIDVSTDFLFDIQVKNFHENTRQVMNLFYCVERYWYLKSLTPEGREEMVKRVTFFSGRAEQNDLLSKNIIQLINQVSHRINNDIDTNNYFKIVFIPDNKVTISEIVIPAADVFESISTPGTEGSATNNMRAALCGSLLIASKDGSNFEIGQDAGSSNVFFFGTRFCDAENIRNENIHNNLSGRLRHVLDCLQSGYFGNINYISDYISALYWGNDFYLVARDYDEYATSQGKVDNEYRNSASWYTMALNVIFSMNRFTSDYVVDYYSKKVWNVEPFEMPEPAVEGESRIILPSSNQKSLISN